MLLLNPKQHDRYYPDERSRQIMRKPIAFFENKGLKKVKEDDHARAWYADFLEFVKQEELFATLLTPAGYGEADDCRWDTWRNCEFNEILGFYGLAYWYTWQVSILGLGPIWMSRNEALKRKAARLLKEGNVFAFGLSEREHGADIYATEMSLTPRPDGTYLANGEKYYIGNANLAPMVSTFGKMADTGEYVFFVADYRHTGYELIRNVTASQNYVAQYALHDYPVTGAEILSRGDDAWNTCLNTVNEGKFNLGWASIGICTHAFYEAIRHAANRRLYHMYVTDFPHVRRMFVDASTRLVAIVLIVKFMPNYFFRPGEYPEVPQRNDPANDDFLFDQGPARGLGKIRFHDYGPAFETCDLPNIHIFKEQIAGLKELLAFATPDDAQQKDVDFLLALGEIFTLVVYGQLILEHAGIYEVGTELLDQVFDFMVRDFARHALNIYSKPGSTPRQMDYSLRMIRKQAVDVARFGRVWKEVHALKDAYEMNP